MLCYNDNIVKGGMKVDKLVFSPWGYKDSFLVAYSSSIWYKIVFVFEI